MRSRDDETRAAAGGGRRSAAGAARAGEQEGLQAEARALADRLEQIGTLPLMQQPGAALQVMREALELMGKMAKKIEEEGK